MEFIRRDMVAVPVNPGAASHQLISARNPAFAATPVRTISSVSR